MRIESVISFIIAVDFFFLPTNVVYSQVTPSSLTSDEEILLNTHNMHRSATALGNTPGQPRATDMTKLIWNKDLASAAQTHADKCKFRHGTTGENLWALGGGGPVNPPSNRAADAWYNEHSKYDYNNLKCSGVCGHYTEMVWAATREMGCGIAQCSNSIFPAKYEVLVVCRYAPGGNWVNYKPYTRASNRNLIASDCPSGYNANISTGLCEKSTIQKMPTESPSESPVFSPTKSPTFVPTQPPTFHPTKFPTNIPTKYPTIAPTFNSTTSGPTKKLAVRPTLLPTANPTLSPTYNPTKRPTLNPTNFPSVGRSAAPSLGIFQTKVNIGKVIISSSKSGSKKWKPKLKFKIFDTLTNKPIQHVDFRIRISYRGKVKMKKCRSNKKGFCNFNNKVGTFPNALKSVTISLSDVGGKAALNVAYDGINNVVYDHGGDNFGCILFSDDCPQFHILAPHA